MVYIQIALLHGFAWIMTLFTVGVPLQWLTGGSVVWGAVWILYNILAYSTFISVDSILIWPVLPRFVPAIFVYGLSILILVPNKAYAMRNGYNEDLLHNLGIFKSGFYETLELYPIYVFYRLGYGNFLVSDGLCDCPGLFRSSRSFLIIVPVASGGSEQPYITHSIGP